MPRRGLLREALEAAPETRRLPLHCRPPGRHQPLPRRDQRQPKALHLDRRSRQNHRRRQTRASSVRFDPLAATASQAMNSPRPHDRFVVERGAPDLLPELPGQVAPRTRDPSQGIHRVGHRAPEVALRQLARQLPASPARSALVICHIPAGGMFIAVNPTLRHSRPSRAQARAGCRA